MADLQPQLDLVRWVKQEEGFLHPDVEVASDPGNRGFHIRVVAGRTIWPNTRIASCPISITLSILNALDITPFGSHGVDFPPAFLNKQSPTVVQYFFLMEQYLLGSKSWWAPYISAVPPPDVIGGMASADGNGEMLWLAGTNLKGALAKQNERWKELYITASTQLVELRWKNTERYTWRLFLWATMVFGSRGFASQVLSDTLPADQARPAGHGHPRHQELSKLFSDGFPVLCPLLDILNYKPGAQVEWQPRFSYVGLQVLEQHESGQEICNNYGPRDNENLMLGYRFAIPSNPFDHFSVALRVPAGSPLAQTRIWYSDKKETDFQCYIFNPNHPRAESASCLEATMFSYDLLDSISVLCANDRELQVMFKERKTYLSTRLASRTSGNNRNVLHTFVQLYRECQQRLSVLQMSDPRPKGEVARTPQQRYAQIYRDSQMEILATATWLCKYTLLRAQTSRATEAVLQLVNVTPQQSQQLDQTAVSNLGRLMHRHRSLIQTPELFDFSSLYQFLPLEISEPVLAILARQPPTSHTQRVRLVVLVAFLRTQAIGILPGRFRTWLAKLDSWYDQSWSILTPDSDGKDDADSVRILLTSVAELARTLCEKPHYITLEGLTWAWNVVAEESVQVPKGLVATQSGQCSGEHAGSDSLLLYIPQ